MSLHPETISPPYERTVCLGRLFLSFVAGACRAGKISTQGNPAIRTRRACVLLGPTCIVRAFLSFSSSKTAVFCLSVMFSHSLRRSALARTLRAQENAREFSRQPLCGPFPADFELRPVLKHRIPDNEPHELALRRQKLAPPVHPCLKECRETRQDRPPQIIKDRDDLYLP